MFCRILVTCLLIIALPAAVWGQQAKTTGELARDVEQLQQDMAELSTNLTNALSMIQENKQSITVLTDVVQEELEKQRQILNAISRPDTNSDYVLNLRANMSKSEGFRREVREAVNESIDTRGNFLVTNKTATYQRIFVNRIEYGILPGDTVTLDVPVGTVTAELPGQQLSTWTISAPAYTQRIEIVPEFVDPAPPVYFTSLPTYVFPY